MNNSTLGIIATAVPLIVIGFLALRRLPWIFAFFVALVAVGIGYLDTTGTMKDVGHKVRAALPAGMLPEHKRAEESAPSEGGAMKALPPSTAPEGSSTQTPAAAPTPPPAGESTPPAATPPAAESTPPPAAPSPETNTSPPSPTPPAAPTPAPANP
jgi:hypothetical protein